VSAVPPVSPQQRDERLWAMAAHIIPLFGFPILAPLVIMLAKPLGSEFIHHHAKQSLIFHITLLVLTIVLCITIIGIIALPAVAVLCYVGGIIAALKANDGVWYRFPVIGGKV
jgi:uncharacterized Tic20 family protein